MFILVPALLGLKGNLEMTLASRLSTHANLGRMDEPGAMWSLLLCNMGLIQVREGSVGVAGTARRAARCSSVSICVFAVPC